MDISEEIPLLQQQIDEIDNLKDLNHLEPRFRKWKKRTELPLRNIFGKDSHHLRDFQKLSFCVLRMRLAEWPRVDQHDIKQYREDLCK